MWTSRFRRILTIGCVIVASLAGTACVQRNVERISRDEAESIPPPPPPQPVSPDVGGPVEEIATRIAGVIEVAPDLASSVPSDSILYLIVRVAGREGGAPLAVKQLPTPPFPYAFEITERDSMIENTPLIGEMSITVRVDQDGDAFTSTDGDLAGQVSPVVAGDDNVVIVLDERVAGGADS